MSSKDTESLTNELAEAKDVADFLTANQENFCELTLAEFLQRLLVEKRLTKSEVIAASTLNVGYAHHIFAGRKPMPTRGKVLALALAMRLSPKEADRLLYYAGAKKLYPKSPWDSIVWYALENNMSVTEANLLLTELGENELLG